MGPHDEDIEANEKTQDTVHVSQAKLLDELLLKDDEVSRRFCDGAACSHDVEEPSRLALLPHPSLHGFSCPSSEEPSQMCSRAAERARADSFFAKAEKSSFFDEPSRKSMDLVALSQRCSGDFETITAVMESFCCEASHLSNITSTCREQTT
jgi:hypothetical protein